MKQGAHVKLRPYPPLDDRGRIACGIEGCDIPPPEGSRKVEEGQLVFCALHRRHYFDGVRLKLRRVRCSILGCKNAASQSSATNKLAGRGTGTAYCSDHAGGPMGRWSRTVCERRGCKSIAWRAYGSVCASCQHADRVFAKRDQERLAKFGPDAPPGCRAWRPYGEACPSAAGHDGYCSWCRSLRKSNREAERRYAEHAPQLVR